MSLILTTYGWKLPLRGSDWAVRLVASVRGNVAFMVFGYARAAEVGTADADAIIGVMVASQCESCVLQCAISGIKFVLFSL